MIIKPMAYTPIMHSTVMYVPAVVACALYAFTVSIECLVLAAADSLVGQSSCY